MAEIATSELIFNIVVIAVSLVVLNWASNTTINNALRVSSITKLGKTSVGFTLISLSTTLPELTVALTAAFSGGAGLSFGNALGSNIFNISAIIGIAAILMYIKHIRVPKSSRSASGINVIPSLAKADLNTIYFGLLVSSLIPMVLIYISTASWIVGLILLFIFAAYIFKLTQVRIPSEQTEEVPLEEKKKLKRYIVLTIIGALGVVVSANFLVDSAIVIASSFGVPQTVIGATIIAFGTSLPELTIGVKSVLKGHAGLAFGNIIGASFFNTTLILGVTFFVPYLVGTELVLNMVVFRNIVTFSIIINMFFWYFLSQGKISLKEGALFLGLYALFLFTTIVQV
ncbi:MAG: sodium:calcium antiporter [Candidatus Bathyarchaeia archaeon]|jgi:cation:H+ antiporter